MSDGNASLHVLQTASEEEIIGDPGIVGIMAPLPEWLRDIEVPVEHETLVGRIATADGDNVGAVLHNVLQLDLESQLAQAPRDVNSEGLLTTQRTGNPADSLREIDDHVGLDQTTHVNGHEVAPCPIDPGSNRG